jgi:hypothetical protein
VLANNDVPGGAAHIEIQLEVDSSWPGWDSSFEPLELQFSQGVGAQGHGEGGHQQGQGQMPQSMSISGMQSMGSLQSMPSMNQQGFNQSMGSMPSLPSLNLPSPSTRDVAVGLGGRIHSDESLITPNRLGNRLRKTMSVSSASGQKRVSSLFDGKDDDMALRRTQSMKKGKPTINLTARTGAYDVARGLASPFVKMQDVGTNMYRTNTAADELLMEGLEDIRGDHDDAMMNDHGHQDAVSAFVELMMTTFDTSTNESDGREQVPVIEIPKRPSPLNLAAIDDSYLDSLLKAEDPTFFSSAGCN